MMRLKCPHCGHVGTDEEPHQLVERWAENDFGFEDETAELIAEGYDPNRTSAAWFVCWDCKGLSPFMSWDEDDPMNPNNNMVQDDGVTPHDPWKPDQWGATKSLSELLDAKKA